jgi:hypothetical protein
MKRFLLICITVVPLLSCNDNYINHKIEFKRLGACGETSPLIQMESNIAGNRFVFNHCLPEDFNEKGYSVMRSGDTLLVSFKQKPDQSLNEFTITLDIDANPLYGYLRIGNQVLAIGTVEP